ncbi:LysR family transcriptional regulator [Pseudomonas sp. 3HC3]|uniref:LysR family transcriptional regulator n=1 Tax=Pseudomonas sp. 3HC3 TaxID=2781025 RepID=UPI0038434267
MPNRTHRQNELQDNRLRYLHLSHARGSMRAAAEELGIATSSVSRQIAKLEEELGIDLVKQGSHRISLTAAGEAAVAYFEERNVRYALFMAQLDELRGEAQTTTVIAVGEGLLGAKGINSLQELMRTHLHHKTEIITAPSSEVQRMVLTDEAHLGVVFSPNQPARLCRLYSLAQPLRMIVHRDSELARRSVVSLEEVARQPLVLPGPKFRVRELLDAACRELDIEVVPSMTSNSLAVILDFVRSGLGVTLLAELPVMDELRSGLFKAVTVDCAQMQATEIQVVTRRGRTLDELTRELAIAIAKTMKKAL